MSERATSIQVARAQFQSAMAKIGARVKKGLGGNFRAWGLFTAGKFRGHVGQVLRKRSGKLAQSFTFQATGKDADMEGRFFSRSKYARLHEYGGTVKAVRRKFLAIPLEGSPAMTGAGVGRYGFSLYDTLPGTHSFFFVGGARGGVLMGRKKDGKSPARPWYRLQKSVYVRPRLGFRKQIGDAVKALRESLAQGAQEDIDGR